MKQKTHTTNKTNNCPLLVCAPGSATNGPMQETHYFHYFHSHQGRQQTEPNRKYNVRTRTAANGPKHETLVSNALMRARAGNRRTQTDNLKFSATCMRIRAGNEWTEAGNTMSSMRSWAGQEDRTEDCKKKKQRTNGRRRNNNCEEECETKHKHRTGVETEDDEEDDETT